MASLAQLQGTTLTTIVPSNPVIEPLDGPTSVEDLYDHFPPEVYQQGRDTHLYRLLSALCGDAGAGFLKTQAFQLRLQYEAELISSQSLNAVYGHQFQISRLSDETYTVNPEEDTLTPAQVDEVALADQSYFHRAQEFFTATRFGNSPTGLATMAQAGSGIPADVIEHYKYIFDQYSDLPLGLTPYGHTVWTSEFVVLSRLLNGDFPTREWDAPRGWDWTFTAPVLNTTARPATLTTPMTVTKTYSATPQTALVPEVERNVVDLLDRVRPADTLATVEAYDQKYSRVNWDSVPFASSERIHLSRFVTGSSAVSWPDPDPSQGFFVEDSSENEATSNIGTFPELPVIFHTIDHVVGYTDRAVVDQNYGTPTFYTAPTPGGTRPVDHYIAAHVGRFAQGIVNIFPILASVAPDTQFFPEHAIALQNTYLKLKV